jgi:glucose/arabinose dehydrogenase
MAGSRRLRTATPDARAPRLLAVGPLATTLLAATLATTLLAGCGSSGGGTTAQPVTPPAGAPTFSREGTPPAPASTAGPARLGDPQVLAGGLEAPWGLAFLPDGRALVSERDSGRIVSIGPDGGEATEVARLPQVDASGEGGLLGIAVAPTFDRDGFVFAYYTAGGENRIVRFSLNDPARREQILVPGIPVSGIHNGGRLAFGPDGFLYASTGDASERGRSQDQASLGGKVLRMTPDGRPAPGNPDAQSLVWSSGHRNVQGLAWDDAGRLWASEFGQNTFDEINRIEPGGNYGWPSVEGGGGAPRFRDPLLTWTTDEASPSGMAYARGSLWVAALRGERLWRVDLDGSGGVRGSEPLLAGRFGRLRHVALAPDGSALWVLTSNRDGRGDPVDEDDRVLRVPLLPS